MGNIYTPTANVSDAMKEIYMNYWDKYLKDKTLSLYLQDWAEQPEWVVAKCKAMEDEMAALKQERDAVISGARKFVEALREELGYHDDYYDRRDW